MSEVVKPCVTPFVDSVLRIVDGYLIPNPELILRDAERIYDLSPGLTFADASELAMRLRIRYGRNAGGRK